MKKILLGTTALVAVSVAVAPGARASDPIKLGLGGFMVQTFGYAENNSDYENAGSKPVGEIKNWDQKQASEVHFTGSAGLDNGITVSARIELNTDGDTAGGSFGMDEVFAKVASPTLGTLILGQEDGAISQLGHRGPAGGVITVDGGEVQPWAFIQRPSGSDSGITSYGGGSSTTSINTFPDEQNTNRITYLSPRFMGLGFGLSFNPDIDHTSRAAQPAGGAAGSGYSAALAYDGTLGGVKIGADVGYDRNRVDSEQSANGSKTIRGGLSLSYAGFTLGGAYARHVEPTFNWTTASPSETTSWDGRSWDVGLTYATGPYTVGVTHARTRAEGYVSETGQDEVRFTVVGGTYTLGPGVVVGADLMFADYDDESTELYDNNDGWGANASLVLAF